MTTRDPLDLGKLVFGNMEQIIAIRALERDTQANVCDTCEGEGTIPCPDCNGSGEKEARISKK